MEHYNKASTKNSILNTFIGKNSPTLVKNEVRSWLSYMDDNQNINYDTDEKDIYGESDIITQNTNCNPEVPRDENSPVGTKPRKKKSFTSLIFRESFVESDSTK